MTTVNCRDARALLMPYLDSELDAAATASVQEHLAVCATCARRFEREARLESALADVFRVGTMPADVSERLDARLVEASGMPADVARRLDERLAAEASGGVDVRPADAPPAPSPILRLSASAWRWVAAAAVLLVAVTLWFADRGAAREDGPDWAGRFVSAWEAAAERRTAPTVVDADGVRAMLAAHAVGQVPFPLTGRVHDHSVELLGAREERFDGVRAVNVLYDCCGVVTSVFVVPVGALDALRGAKALGAEPVDLVVDGVRARGQVRDGALIGVVSRHASGLEFEWAD